MNRKITVATILIIAVMALLMLQNHLSFDTYAVKGDNGNETHSSPVSYAQQPDSEPDSTAEQSIDENKVALLDSMQRYSMTARNESQFARLLAKLAEMGIAPDNILPQIMSVSFMADKRTVMSLRENVGNVFWEIDMPVSRPVPGMSTAMKPFAGKLTEWLGLDRKANRGKGVTIALIDEPVYATESTANANIRQLDLFGMYGSGSHGAAIASILLSDSNYLQGIVPQAELLSIPIVDSNGTGSTFNLASAIVAAVDNGAHIISISLCGDSKSSVLENAVEYAASKGAVIVAAAGNDGLDKKVYPASYSNVVSVSACDANGTATAFSNQSAFVDICAPGVGIWVDDAPPDEDSIGSFSGTSASAPCVAGVIACVMGNNPQMTAVEAKNLVLGSAMDNGKPGTDSVYGAGVLNYERTSRWNDETYTDAAAAGHYFDLNAEEGGYVPLLISGQNSGNTAIGSMTVEYTVNGVPGKKEYNNVRPGETVSAEVMIPVDELDRVSVTTNIRTDAAESNIENNTKECVYSRD